MTRALNRTHEGTFQDAFARSPLASALLDRSSIIRDVNDEFSRLAGRSPADLIGLPLHELGEEAGTSTVRTAASLRVWRRDDGSERWVEVIETPLPSGSSADRICHALDVTSRLHSEREVRELNDLLCARLEELDDSRGRLASAFRQLSQVSEDERKKIAVGIHDEAVQHMIAASWLLDDLESGQDGETVERIRGSIQNAIDSLRHVITDLRPVALDACGLADALSRRAAMIFQTDDIEPMVKDLSGHRFPREVESLAYRIAVEALHNVRKHSRAQQVTIELGERFGSATVRIIDDGVGFSSERALERSHAGHIGVVSMKEQVLLAGGDFRIGDRADGHRGTEVSFTLPCEDSPART